MPLSRNPFPPTVPFSLRVDSAVPMKRIVASGLGYGLLPFSGIHEEIEAGKLSAALLPWMRADRVLALLRGRPASRATREVFAGLRQVCQDLITKARSWLPGRARDLVDGRYTFSRRFDVTGFAAPPGAKPCRNNSTAISANSCGPIAPLGSYQV